MKFDLRISLLLLLCSQLCALVAALPEGFIEEPVTSTDATTGFFAPNPRNDGKPMLLLSTKGGAVSVLEDPDRSSDAIEVLDMQGRICTNGERGINDITAHPNFLENNYIYISFSQFRDGCLEDPQRGPMNVVARYLMDPVTLEIDIQTEEVLLSGAPCNKMYHNAGAMEWGVNGELYITTGDAGGDADLTSQDMTNLHGSLLRVLDDGTVPANNPFTVASGYKGVRCGLTGGWIPPDAPQDSVCSEIWASGLRNPFRIAKDMNSVDKDVFHIGDVGGAYWEEVSLGGTDMKGVNYGWPLYEGPCAKGTIDECEMPAQFSDPLYYYEHRTIREGGAITGSSFVPDGIWPEEFKYLFIDFVFLEIYNMIKDESMECRECIPPVPAYRNETFYTSIQQPNTHVNQARMVDMFFGPYEDTQALYVFKFAGRNSVFRIRYIGEANRPPVPKIVLEKDLYAVNDTVSFSSNGTFDSDGDELVYQWDFGDGGKSNKPNPKHNYMTSGRYEVKLQVTDSTDQVQSTSETIQIGNRPTVVMFSPRQGDKFSVGQALKVLGWAYDEDGNDLPDSQIEWEVRKHHAEHFHPFLDLRDGNNFNLFPAPEPEDYLAATNSYLEVIMTATDDKGLKTTLVRDVPPNLVFLDIDTNQPGLQLMVDDYPLDLPATITSWAKHELRLRVEDQFPYTFGVWSDGEESERVIDLEAGTMPAMELSFCQVSNTTCVINEDCCSRNCDEEVCSTETLPPSPTPPPGNSPAVTASQRGVDHSAATPSSFSLLPLSILLLTLGSIRFA